MDKSFIPSPAGYGVRDAAGLGFPVIDAHSHLWYEQNTTWNGMAISPLPDGRAMFLGTEVQMLPPFMLDGRNTAEVFLSNMNYAQVSAAVVVQEFIDGIQNAYLADVARRFPDRFKVCAMYDYLDPLFRFEGVAPEFSGVAIPGHRIITSDRHVHLTDPEMMRMFRYMEENDLFLSMCLANGDEQTGELREVIEEYPNLRVAIGHFCMPTVQGWKEQLKLALHENVMVESGGITWLYNSEFYPYPTAVRAIKEAADMVGMDKLMWGSDYPRTTTSATYSMTYDFILHTKEFSQQEKESFLGSNAVRFYGFQNLPQLRYVRNMSE